MSAKRALAGGVAVLLLGVAAATAETPFCLPDADGDGHPLFGNPEVMLNPFAPLMGLNSLVPVDGAVGDLDGDGDVDAVATYAWPDPMLNPATQVSVLLNKGDGVFVADAVYDPGDFPSCVAIGDLDGNGLNDLAITNVIAGTVSVMINAGAATFPTRVPYAVGTKPRSVVMADLDGDTDLDLAVANGQANTVSILKNNGDGTLAVQVSYAVTNIPDFSVLLVAFGGPYLAVGDVDGDQDIDLAVPVSTGVSILKNNGNGTFAPQTTFPSGGSVWAVAIGDIDGDLDADLIAARFASDVISVLKNNGNATFAAPTTFSVVPGEQSGIYEPATVALGDLDGDGDLDLAGGLTSSVDFLPVWKNQGDGTFGDIEMVFADERPRVVHVADVNVDAHLDLAVFAFGSTTEKLCSLLNDGTGAVITEQPAVDPFAPPTPNPWVDASQIEFLDLDNDGHLDLVVLSPGDPMPNLAVELNLGQAGFSNPVHYAVEGFYPNSMAIADLDGDSDWDIVLAGPETITSSTPGFLAAFLNSGDGNLLGPTLYPTNGLSSRYVTLADVDNDLDSDAIVTNLSSDSLSLFVNSGFGEFEGTIVIEVPMPSPYFIVSGDVDNDGHSDLAITQLGGPQVLLMWGTGIGTFIPGPIYEFQPKAARAALADLDDDCDLDLVVSSDNTTTQAITFTTMMNVGFGEFDSPVVYWLEGSRDAGAIAPVDADSDGNLDVVIATRHAISLFLGSGDGSLMAGGSYGTGRDVQFIAAGDLDGDGNVDLGSADLGSDSFSILWNQNCATPQHASDLDADGDVDLADFLLLLECLGGPGVCSPGLCNPPGFANSDLDGDGDVDLRDLRGALNATLP